MSDQWILRVQGKEYGPVDMETLREWQRDGRVIPDNELRKSGESVWQKAGTVMDLFAPGPPPEETLSPRAPRRRRTLPEILTETLHIYRKGFVPFLFLSLLVAIPSCLLKISLAYFRFPEHGLPTSQALAPRIFAIVAGAALLAAWPVFLAGIQVATADVEDGRPIGLRDVLRRAITFWPRVAKLCLLVYGSYFVWTAIPLLAMFSLVVSEPTGFSIVIALAILALQVYMTARLWVNFLFWQQSSVLAGFNTLEALRESKDLAHSRSEVPRLERPLYRGVIVASLWFLLVLVVGIGAEMPFVLVRLQGITTPEQAMSLFQNLANASTPDAITLATYVVTSLVQAALRPLLGIAFVLLYFDAK